MSRYVPLCSFDKEDWEKGWERIQPDIIEKVGSKAGLCRLLLIRLAMDVKSCLKVRKESLVYKYIVGAPGDDHWVVEIGIRE